jgi:hypothetical protein
MASQRVHHHKGTRCRVAVIRDGDPDLLRNPKPQVFHPVPEVIYHHVSEPAPLAAASHYFFHCERFSERIHDWAVAALNAQGSVTIIIRRVDRALAEFVERAPVSVIPASGCAGQITDATLERAVKMTLAGERVVSQGFIRNSVGAAASADRNGHSFLDMLQAASRAAYASTAVVAAVLALPRTGSKFLHDLIGMTVGSQVRTFHEHEVPADDAGQLDSTRPLVDQMMLELDDAKKRSIKKAILRHAILNQERRYVFVTERNPQDRIVSYFLTHYRQWLRSSFDVHSDVFRNVKDIQRMFDRWTRVQAKAQRNWYRETLLRPFGLNVLKAERTLEGLFVTHHGPNTLVVVPSDRLNVLMATAAAEFGARSYAPVADNSAKSRGDEAIDRVFRRDISFDPAVAKALWKIPEVAHVHRCHG